MVRWSVVGGWQVGGVGKREEEWCAAMKMVDGGLGIGTWDLGLDERGRKGEAGFSGRVGASRDPDRREEPWKLEPLGQWDTCILDW